MNIYDCFMYFDEDMLLDLRLNILNKYVKKFVITESTYLHSGNKKKLNFDIKNFSQFKDKIEYIVVDEPPKGIEKIKDEDLKGLTGMTISMLALLAKENILNLNDFADLASYELIDKEEGIFRKLELDEDLVNQMIMDAREKSFS